MAAVIGGGLFVLVGLIVWVRSPETRTASRPQDLGAARASGGVLAGPRACRDCHPGEYAAFTRSGHSRTLRPAADRDDVRALAGHTVSDPEHPGVTWTYTLDGDEFGVVRRDAGQERHFRIDYAFGSGHHATTFVTMLNSDPDRPELLEHRLTRYALGPEFDITPGQKRGSVHGQLGWGYVLTPREALKCVGCHSTETSDAGNSTLDLATVVPNVTCERCHRPARQHVEAALRGETGPAMSLPIGNWSADELMTLCGQCHRDPAKAPPGLIAPGNRQLARFQPVGLAQSRCYKEADGALNCVTCHEPHARASPDLAHYEAICLQCHRGPERASCPESPRGGCIGCHMPGVDSGQNVRFTDHWIRVRDEAELRSLAGPPAG